jgi:hypothetical protein
MEVVEVRLLMSVNTISRMAPDCDPTADAEVEDRDPLASGTEDGGAWWL